MKAQVRLPENLTEIAIATLKDRLIEELGNTLMSIVLFGSRQRGRFVPDSDIDILIIIKEKNHTVVNKIFEIADRVEDSALSYSIPFSIHIQSEQEYKRLKDMKSLFINEIESEGRIVYERKAQS
jgi:predicted nucleotidyltransferase